RTPSEEAKPQASDAAEKNVRPMMNMRLRPSRSAARPPRRRKPPNVIAYAVMTHCKLSFDAWSERPIDGSATVTIEPSRVVMKHATQTSARARQRRGSGVVLTIGKPNAAAG